MKYVQIKPSEFPPLYRTLIKKPNVCKLNVIRDDDETVYVLGGLANETNALPDGCVTLETWHAGGTILSFKDGISLASFDYSPPTWLRDLVNLLRERGIDAEKVDNDVIVDGKYKVCGYMSRSLENGLRFYATHISIHVDVDLIHKVCKKPMQKIPKGLSEWGITRKDVLDALGIE